MRWNEPLHAEKPHNLFRETPLRMKRGQKRCGWRHQQELKELYGGLTLCAKFLAGAEAVGELYAIARKDHSRSAEINIDAGAYLSLKR